MVPPLRGAAIGPDAWWIDGREARPINPDRTDVNAPVIRPIIFEKEGYRMLRLIISICLLTVISTMAYAKLNLNKDIPGGNDPKNDGEQIYNNVFTMQSALDDIKAIASALSSFTKLTDISRKTMTKDKLREIGNTDSDTQGNGFWNWLGEIEGTLRKQEYQIKKLNYDLAQKRHKLGEIKNEELQKAKKEYEEGEKKFQEYWDSYGVFD